VNPADQGTPSDRPADPLGDALRTMTQSRPLVVGLAAALAIVVLSWMAVVALSLLPGEPAQSALGMKLFRDESLALGPRLVRALFAPWNRAVTWTFVDSPDYSMTFSGVWFFASLVAIAVIAAVGSVVRRVVDATMAARLTALVVSAVACGALLAVCAAVLTYSVTMQGGSEGGDSWTVHFAYPSGLLFLSGAGMTLLVGVFSFGVVDLLPRQFSGALRHGALYAALPCLLVGVLMPLVLSARTIPGVELGGSAFANGSRFSAGVGSAALPLAYGARATFEADAGSTSTPLFAGYSVKDGNAKYRFARLQKYMARNDSARVTGYAGAFGSGWKMVGVLMAVLLIGTWVLVVIHYVASMGAPRSVDGLGLGLLVGLGAAIVLFAITWLSRQTEVQNYGNEIYRFMWGADRDAYLQAAGLMIGIAATTGTVYAAFRPAPRNYTPLRLAGAASSAVVQPLADHEAAVARDAAGNAPVGAATEPPEAEPSDAAGTVVPPVSGDGLVTPQAADAAPKPPAYSRFCPECGAGYTDAGARFCGSCGSELASDD